VSRAFRKISLDARGGKTVQKGLCEGELTVVHYQEEFKASARLFHQRESSRERGERLRLTPARWRPSEQGKEVFFHRRGRQLRGIPSPFKVRKGGGGGGCASWSRLRRMPRSVSEGKGGWGSGKDLSVSRGEKGKSRQSRQVVSL